jgi:hypothetical protein
MTHSSSVTCSTAALTAKGLLWRSRRWPQLVWVSQGAFTGDAVAARCMTQTPAGISGWGWA